MRNAFENTMRIALLFKAKGQYKKDIVEGVCEYVKSTRLMWDILLEEEDFQSDRHQIAHWDGHGIIADFDDQELVSLLLNLPIPVVGIGGSYQIGAARLKEISYVGSDNPALVKMAYEHLIEMGLPNFAFYSFKPTSRSLWALEREEAFRILVESDGFAPRIYEAMPSIAFNWSVILDDLVAWLRSLPKPIGIIAVNDSRARQVMQACLVAGISVPDEVAIIGIDDEPMMRVLNRIPVSSVKQGAHQMGYVAAEMLHKKLINPLHPAIHQKIAPGAINIQASSRYNPAHTPYIRKAQLFIRQFALQGIKAAQVADYVGIARATLDIHFERELGHTVHEEILTFKLHFSQKLLEEGKLGGAEIARLSGFNTLQYMYAVYRRKLGCTPVEYQAKAQGGNTH